MPYQYRKSPRAFWHEYNGGLYFVTVCTKDKRHFFGRIRDGIMYHSKIGHFLKNELLNPGLHHGNVTVVNHVVMPNHFHAIIQISYQGISPDLDARMNKDLGAKRLPLLSQYLGAIKGAVTRFARKNCIEFAWQERFHDHIIRNIEEEYRIAEYIDNNIATWADDCFNKAL